MGLFQGLVMQISCLTLMIGYVGGGAWLWQRGKCHWLLTQSGAIGRMPLTSYITQTSFGVIVFYGYRLALLGELLLLLIPAVVALVIPLQWLFARYWLQSHAQGPHEALWRRYSYPNWRASADQIRLHRYSIQLSIVFSTNWFRIGHCRQIIYSVGYHVVDQIFA